MVLIDLTPEALIARLRAGKVYRPERVPAALNNFFKIENLSALRETALRQVAEDVEIKRLEREPSPVARRDEDGLTAPPEAAPQAIAERLLALVTLAPHSERVVRRAWRSAQRLDAELDVLVVRPPERPPSSEDRQRLEALRRLVVDAGRAPARRGGRGRGGGRDRPGARAGRHLRADGRPRAPRAGSAASAGRSPANPCWHACWRGCRAWISASWPIPACAAPQAWARESASAAGVRGEGDEP